MHVCLERYVKHIFQQKVIGMLLERYFHFDPTCDCMRAETFWRLLQCEISICQRLWKRKDKFNWFIFSEPKFYFDRSDYQVDESVGSLEVKVWKTGTDLSRPSSVTVRSRKTEPISAEGIKLKRNIRNFLCLSFSKNCLNSNGERNLHFVLPNAISPH